MNTPMCVPVAIAVIDIKENDGCKPMTRTFSMCDCMIYGWLCMVCIHMELC